MHLNKSSCCGEETPLSRLVAVRREHRTTPVRGLRAARWYFHFMQDPVKCLCDIYCRFGLIGVMGNVLPLAGRERLHAVAFGPEFNEQVLSNPELFRTTGLTKAGPKPSALRRVRDGLATMNGEKYRRQRQLVMPLFARKVLDAYRAQTVEVVSELVEQWPTDRVFDISAQFHKMMLQSSARVLFGRRDCARADALGEMIHELVRRNTAFLVTYWPLDLPGAPYRGLLKHAERLERSILDLIHDRRAAPTQERDMLDILLRARDEGSRQMTDADLVGQTTFLLYASYVTQASAMSWTAFLLAQHPQIMAELYDELYQTLSGAPPSLDQLERLPLLDAVVKESMRIFPPVPRTIKRITAPVEMGGYSLKKGDRVIISHYVTHHLPEIYPHPERFNPYRWFTIKPSQYEYLPFGGGPRMCIGKGLAMTMTKVALAIILQRWRLRMVPNARVDRSVKVTMGPSPGLPMTVCPQDRRFEAVNLQGNVHEMVDLSEHQAKRTTRFVFQDAASTSLFSRPHFEVGARVRKTTIDERR
jgi:cytochrome P450